MKRCALLLLITWRLGAQDAHRLETQLDEIGRVATAMVDGDLCERILTSRALAHILQKDSRDEWAEGDNYDVDDAAFIATKKTLMRLAQLADFPVDVNLWMPIKGAANRVHIAIRNRYEMSQFWNWGNLTQDTPAPMRNVLAKGIRLVVKQKPGYLSVLAPVRNSLDEVVGVVEVVSQVKPDPRENVK